MFFFAGLGLAINTCVNARNLSGEIHLNANSLVSIPNIMPLKETMKSLYLQSNRLVDIGVLAGEPIIAFKLIMFNR